MNYKINKKGFTLLEVLVVIIIIGILAALGYASLSELIQINRAKETSRVLTAFAERALSESKMRKQEVTIILTGNTIQANASGAPMTSQPLANGFTSNNSNPPSGCGNINNITSQIRIGLSGIEEGCFIACNARNYCGSAVKTNDKNSFTARYKRRSSNDWEAL